MTTHSIDAVFKRLETYSTRDSIISNGEIFSYHDLLTATERIEQQLINQGVQSGSICGFVDDFNFKSCACILALIKQKCILVPISFDAERERDTLFEIAGVEFVIVLNSIDNVSVKRSSCNNIPQLIMQFRKVGHPGLVIFSSGSTGQPKGILQDVELVFKKFIDERSAWRSVQFLQIDHFGGFNTYISTIANGGAAICPLSRSTTDIASSIQDAKADLLPATPTFINLLLASGAYKTYDFSSVKLVTYGTEVMPESTIQKLRTIFPSATFKQTYGLSELGVLRSKSKNDGSLWVKIGGSGFQTKVVDGVLWVKSECNMVGYLNAPNPFDADGWMCTDDHVVVDGEYMRILGRKTDLINVGGQKVYPSEVESIICEIPGVQDAIVYGVKNELMGHVLNAKVFVSDCLDKSKMIIDIKKHCISKLNRFKVPTKIECDTEYSKVHTSRFKKNRKGGI